MVSVTKPHLSIVSLWQLSVFEVCQWDHSSGLGHKRRTFKLSVGFGIKVVSSKSTTKPIRTVQRNNSEDRLAGYLTGQRFLSKWTPGFVETRD